jgi:hypothetical protein
VAHVLRCFLRKQALQEDADVLRIAQEIELDLPPGPGYIAELLIRTYVVLLPLALIDQLHWLALPDGVLM